MGYTRIPAAGPKGFIRAPQWPRGLIAARALALAHLRADTTRPGCLVPIRHWYRAIGQATHGRGSQRWSFTTLAGHIGYIWGDGSLLLGTPIGDTHIRFFPVVLTIPQAAVPGMHGRFNWGAWPDALFWEQWVDKALPVGESPDTGGAAPAWKDVDCAQIEAVDAAARFLQDAVLWAGLARGHWPTTTLLLLTGRCVGRTGHFSPLYLGWGDSYTVAPPASSLLPAPIAHAWLNSHPESPLLGRKGWRQDSCDADGGNIGATLLSLQFSPSTVSAHARIARGTSWGTKMQAAGLL